MWQSPFTLHKRIVAAIRNEAAQAADGKPARIIAKMNALLEPQIIEELYAASAAGVKIELMVRGVCALKPGIEGLSENIRVRSVIGRFLEHTRIFYFHAGGAENVYLASADWMDRNFLPPHRAVLPGARRRAQAPRDPRGAAGLPRRQLPGLGDERRRRV